jgi:hypothetical protein
LWALSVLRGVVKPDALDRRSGAETGKKEEIMEMRYKSKADLRISIANDGSLAMPFITLGVNTPYV